jgi:hypothetical protein
MESLVNVCKETMMAEFAEAAPGFSYSRCPQCGCRVKRGGLRCRRVDVIKPATRADGTSIRVSDVFVACPECLERERTRAT